MTDAGNFNEPGGVVGRGGAVGVGSGGKEAKFWYVGSKFLQERAKFSNLKWDRELKRKLERLAKDERMRLYDLQQEIYAIRSIYRSQKMERWSSRLNAELNAAEAAGYGERRHAEQLGDWIDAPVSSSAPASATASATAASAAAIVVADSPAAVAGPDGPADVVAADVAAQPASEAALEQGRRRATTPTSVRLPGLEPVVLRTRGGFVYRPIQRPRSIRERRDAGGDGDADEPSRKKQAAKNPSSRELLMSLLGDKFSSEDAIRERIARRHKVDFHADEYTDGALAYAKRQFDLEKNRYFSRNVKASEHSDRGEGKTETTAKFYLDETKLKRLQVAQQQMSYNRSLRHIESFLGVTASSTSRRASQPPLSDREAKVISLLRLSPK